jgi:hypothetical protein
MTQLSSWLVIILTTKVIITSIMVELTETLNNVANWLFEPLSKYPRAELLLVMIACPCFMNAMQFWVRHADNLHENDFYGLVMRHFRYGGNEYLTYILSIDIQINDVIHVVL